MCDSGVSVYGFMCAHVSVDAEGKIQCTNKPGSQKASVQLMSTLEVKKGCGHTVQE